MKIYEDTITRFFTMLELYTPYKMRPRLWDEQTLTEEYWNAKIKQPIRKPITLFQQIFLKFSIIW